ncbi:MAG: flagellar export protein FliJ [Deltaproteobacteria bacterium]|nr:flagellar export protein FliJ [Deltaproteobacteria bacterium]
MFRFRLQSVLEVRERLTRLRLKDFSEVQARVQGLHDRMEENQRSIAQAGRRLDQSKQGNLTAFTLQQHGRYRTRLQGENQRLALQIREQRQELEDKRKSLVEARRAQRTLEILRDKAASRHEEQQQRQERAQLDEISSSFFVFKNRPSDPDRPEVES